MLRQQWVPHLNAHARQRSGVLVLLEKEVTALSQVISIVTTHLKSR